MIVVISSRSGGVGKSTASMHLAAYLAQRRGVGSVALVDADNNESCLDWVQRGPGQKFEVVDADNEELDLYDHLIIDTAAAPDSDELGEVLESADLLLIPTTPSPIDISPAIATAQSIEADGIESLLLLTLCPPAPSTVGTVALAELKSVGLPTVPRFITRRNCYLQAAIDGVTVGQMKGASATKAWREWQAAGQYIFKGRL